jgi:hypothetical protein
MTDREEHRRAPRTVVDVEALLRLSGLRTCPGIIQDLSYLGALFVPGKTLHLEPGSLGHLRFALPTAAHWLEPKVEIKRTTTFARSGGEPGQAFGMQFSGLTRHDEDAISAGCQDWNSYRVEQYEFAARCYAQSDGAAHYARFGQLVGGTRTYLRLSLPTGPGLERGMALKLRIGRTWLASEVEKTNPDGPNNEVLLRIAGWGRDFFLHEARRHSMAAAR